MRLEKKDILLLIPATLLAFAGLGPDDRWVVGPCLLFSWVSFIALCVLHEGSKPIRVSVAIALTVVLAFVGYRRLDAIGNPTKNESSVESAPKVNEDPKYPQSTNKLTRIDSNTPPAASVLCPLTMSDDARRMCLCPRVVPYQSEALATPPDNNYATLVTVSSPREPMYKIRIFLRDVFSKSIPIFPTQDMLTAEHFSMAQGLMDYDRTSFTLQSTKAQPMYKIQISSSTGLRIICINQID